MSQAILQLLAVSFALAFALTWMMIQVAPRLGFVDKPGGRKIHANPKPLGGGVAIFWSVALPMLGGMVMWMFTTTVPGSVAEATRGGILQQAPMALGLIGCMLAMHLLGLRDDWKALGPYSKLLIQLSITAFFVICFDVRALTALDNLGAGRWPSVAVTVLWIGAITNAFNFLDNMDGLSAGVAAVCTTAFLVTALSIGQWFVAATLALLLGSLLGFLIWNFAPAKIFMGDSGSLLIGFLLGVMTVRTTFLPKDADLGAGWYAVLAPVVVLALPLYDLVVVSIIRMLNGKSPFVGDTNHFSHRLVRRGMSKRTAVLCIYLVTAATSIAAIILPHVRTSFAGLMIFAQTGLILGMVALLEQHPLPAVGEASSVRADSVASDSQSSSSDRSTGTLPSTADRLS